MTTYHSDKQSIILAFFFHFNSRKFFEQLELHARSKLCFIWLMQLTKEKKRYRLDNISLFHLFQTGEKAAQVNFN